MKPTVIISCGKIEEYHGNRFTTSKNSNIYVFQKIFQTRQTR